MLVLRDSPFSFIQHQAADLTNHRVLLGTGHPALTKIDKIPHPQGVCHDLQGDTYKQVYNKMVSDNSKCYAAKETTHQIKTGSQGMPLWASGTRMVTRTQMVGLKEMGRREWM